MNATYTQADLDTTITTTLALIEQYEADGMSEAAKVLLAAVQIMQRQRNENDEE